MRREDIDKLLGGWAAGTLTDAERSALLQAALEDQALFDQLMAEEPLRETLADPVLHGRIERALRSERQRAGWFKRPWAWGLAGSLAATAVMIVGLVQWSRSVRPDATGAAVEMAKSTAPTQPAPEAVPQEPAAPAPQALEAKAKEQKGVSRTPRQMAASDKERKAKELNAAVPAHAFAGASRADAARKPEESAAPGAAAEVVGRVQLAEPPALAPDAPVTDIQREDRRHADRGAALQTAPPNAPAPAAAEAAAPVPPQPSAFVRREIVPSEGARALFERAGAQRAKRASDASSQYAGGAARTAIVTPPKALGLRYRILCRTAEGGWAEADPDRRFRHDDALRLEIGLNERAYYYAIINDGVLASGLVSHADAQSIYLPSGTTRVTLIASRTPLADPLRARRSRSESLVEKSGGAVYVAKTSFVPDSQVTAEIVLRYEE